VFGAPGGSESNSRNILNNYIGLLVAVNFVYMILILTLLGIGVKVRDSIREHRKQQLFMRSLTLEERQVDWVYLWNFLFLQGSLFCRLVTTGIILVHVMGLISTEESSLPVFFLRIFYHLSIVFLYVACSLNLYEWLLIIFRVNFFGGIFSLKDYKRKARTNKVLFIVFAVMVSMINITLIFLDAIDPTKPKSVAVTLVIALVFAIMLISFTVIGSILIRNLRLFFKKNYNKQRSSLIVALLLIIASLSTLALRYFLEYAYQMKHLKMSSIPDTHDAPAGEDSG
jgi:hypothetical protein